MARLKKREKLTFGTRTSQSPIDYIYKIKTLPLSDKDAVKNGKFTH
jgi:hypothetical protein